MADRDVAVIIGVGPNLGAALARRFAAGGCDVAMIARSVDTMYALSEEIDGATTVKGFPADATDLDALRAALARIAADMGPPTVLIHNVSRWIPADATELDPATLADELTLGATAALAASQAVLGGMMAAGRGTILWTGSAMALRPAEAGLPSPALTAGKSALRGLAMASAGSFQDKGVHFTTVTVNGTIEAGGAFDPGKIADAFWDAHQAPRDDWRPERVFEGA